MSMAKCKNTILSRSLNDNHHQAKRSPPIDHQGHHHGHSSSSSHSHHHHHPGSGGGTHHGHHSSSSSSHGHHHGHHTSPSSSTSNHSGSTVAAHAAHQHNHHAHTGHHQQPPQIAHHHSFHPSTAHHHHHPHSTHHGNFNPPTSDPLPTSLYAKHVMSSSSTINSNSNLVNANDHHHSPHHHSSHHSSHHNSHHGGGSHHNSHHSPNHHSSHHNFHHLHGNYSIYGDSSTPERDLLSSSSSSGATGNHLSITSRNLSHGGGSSAGGHESSLSPNLGPISTTALELSTHTYHGEDHATASPPSMITRRSHWNEVTGVNEGTGGGNSSGGKGLNIESGVASGGGEGATDVDGDGSDSGSTNLNPSTPQSIYDSSMSAIDNSSSSLMGPNLKKAKRQPQPIPENCKDDAYWERRRRNNESAKRSRESRRRKEHQTHLKVKMLEQENMRLLAKVSILENEVEKLRKMVYDRRDGGNGVIMNGEDGREEKGSGDHKMIH